MQKNSQLNRTNTRPYAPTRPFRNVWLGSPSYAARGGCRCRLAAAGSALRFAHDIASQSAAGTCAVEWVAAQVARAESAGVGAHPLTALAAMAAFHSLGAHTEGEQRYRGLVAAVQSDSGASARRRRRRQRQRASKAGSGGALG